MICSFLADLPTSITILSTLAVICILGFNGAPILLWTMGLGAWLWATGTPLWLLIILAIPTAFFLPTPLRAKVLTNPLMQWMKKTGFLPAISDTERTAIDAGTVWVDGDLFSGKPNFRKLMNEPYPELSEEEQAFVNGPTEEVCRITDDWDVWQRRDLSPQTWDFLKKNGFFGLIIPKEYGGHGFSAAGNSAIVKKLSSASGALGISVMVPNSLGPAELLMHYGTKEQKNEYLPKLASGEEMPAFALTEPGAGSDAAAMTSTGVLFKGDDGEIHLRLNWDKRYISLAGIATVLGLAFKLSDPDQLLGKGKELGITCALVPTTLPGITIGERHDPLGVPFWNCPTIGKDVVVGLDAIIGGAEGAGEGWRMLMECLAAGRGISLPASATAGTLGAARLTGAYSAVRKQFGLAIGRFEGIEEPMARIGASAYRLEAARRYTCGALNQGKKPAVVTAMAKYHFTETMRSATNDAMDVLGGAGISRGPRNMIAHGYIGIPIMITVEGANILTRTLMIFGQGAIRCHPYAYKEISAMQADDLKGFDKAFWGHTGHVVQNTFRTVLLSISRGWLARPPVSGPTAQYYRKLAWASASFALMADVAMASLGGDLKRKEKLTGRFADIFSWLYFGTAVLRRYEAEGRRAEDLPFVHWNMREALSRMQEAFDGIYANMKLPVASWLLRGPIALWSRLNPFGASPSDKIGGKIAQALQVPGEQREALTTGLFMPTDLPDHQFARLERAMKLSTEANAVTRKIGAAIKAKKLEKARPAALVEKALEEGIITMEEAQLLQEAEAARADAVAVDSFTQAEYLRSAKAATSKPDRQESMIEA